MRNWIAVNAVQQSNKREIKYEEVKHYIHNNSAGAWLLLAFAGGESGRWCPYRGFMGCHLYQRQSKQPDVAV
jgi:hypothetical protein